jgi:hypothetical protein
MAHGPSSQVPTKPDTLNDEARSTKRATGQPWRITGHSRQVAGAFEAVLISDTKENNMQNETTKPKTKPPDREAVRVLAIELGAR